MADLYEFKASLVYYQSELHREILTKKQISRAVVAHAFNPSTQEAEASGSLYVQVQPGLQSEFQDSQGYTEKNLS